MDTIQQRTATRHWAEIGESLNEKGYAVVPQFLTHEECDNLAALYTNDSIYRKTVVMERHNYGSGEYRYFDYPLPSILSSIRKEVYPYLSVVANGWMKALKIDKHFPAHHDTLLEQCKASNQPKPTVLILRYGQGGFNAMHQDLYGDIYFPMQAVIMLNEPTKDYAGGEFVLIEQMPRAQSKATVLTPKKGDMLIFTTNFRAAKGSRGYYRAMMKHGVSLVHSGNRMALGIIFHDAEK